MRNECVAGVDHGREPVRPPAWEFFQPYAEFEADFVYNSLFCDNLALFRRDLAAAPKRAGAALICASLPSELHTLAVDEAAASRVRALAWQGLRAAGFSEPSRDVLGVVIELPHAHSQDTLAAYADGSVRHIRHSGEIAAYDANAAAIAARAAKLVTVAQKLLQRLERPSARRSAPPGAGQVRITLIGGDGHHVCEGPFQSLQKDPLAGPVLGNAVWLLQAQAQAS